MDFLVNQHTYNLRDNTEIEYACTVKMMSFEVYYRKHQYLIYWVQI